MIAMYDLEDNYIMSFDNYKECAEYFKTTSRVISSHMCMVKKGKIDKKLDRDGKYVRLFKIEEEVSNEKRNDICR